MSDGKKNSGDRNSGDRNSGDMNSGYRNSGYWNSGDWNSGHMNSGHMNSGDRNSGHWNSGDWNSGDRNSGMFNTNEPNARLFNKDCGKTMSQLIEDNLLPSFGAFPNLEWIDVKDMTETEKSANPSHTTTGGFLRQLDYKEAWAKSWKNTDENNRAKLKALPGFCPDIFLEITGIDLREKPTTQPIADTIVLNGKTYRLVEENQ